MLKKTITIALLLVLFLCARSETIRIMHHKNYYPYSFVNSNGLSDGVLIDYWRKWAEVNHLGVEFIAANESDFVDYIESGKADLIAGTFYSDSLSEILGYSDYIMRIDKVLFLKSGNKPKTVDNIDFKLLALKSVHTEQFLKSSYPKLNVVMVTGFADFVDKVKKQEYGGFIYDYPSPINSKTSFKTPKNYTAFYTLASDRIRPAFKRGNMVLRKLLVSGSNNISNQELLDIANKWNIVDKSHDYTLVILFFLLLFIVFAVFYIFALKKQSKQARIIADFESSEDWQVIIDKGETDQIEFKSTLRWDLRQGKPNKALEQVIVKTISAFLNTSGGLLFIGVDDDGNILGLENDYQSFSKKNRDGFSLTITNLINQSLGKSAHKFISVNIISINNNDVCIVSVEKSKNPVFLGKGDREEFYIRASASSQPLGMRETYKYISSHWEK